MLGLSALFLLYVFYKSFRREAQSKPNTHIEQHKSKDQEVGFATSKWSDDDDYKGPITPFIRPIK